MNKLLLAAAALAVSAGANAAPIQWTGSGSNGHWYEYVGNSVSWTSANTAANAATFFDGSNTLNGYLVTITSAAENSFLAGLASDAWIGASDADAEGNWKWVGGPEAGTTFWLNGSTVTYASWNGGEPNNAGVENYAHYQGGNWNDLPNGASRGYFVEYSGASAVPEPAMLGLFGLGAIGLVAGRRRKA